MSSIRVLMVEPGPVARTRKLEQVHGVLFDNSAERAYVEPDKSIQGWRLKGSGEDAELVRDGRVLLLARDQDVPPEISAGPDAHWRSSNGPSRWDARDKLYMTEQMRGSQGGIATSRLEVMAIIGMLGSLSWMVFGAGVFMYQTFGLGGQ